MPRRRQQGFTMIELTVSMVVSAIIVSVLIGLFTTTTKAFFRQQEIAETQANLRFAMEIMRGDFQRAGFHLNPVYTSDGAGIDNTSDFVPMPVLYNERTSAGAATDSPIITLIGNFASGSNYPAVATGTPQTLQMTCLGGGALQTPGCDIDNPLAAEANDPARNPFFTGPHWTNIFCANQLVHISGRDGLHQYSRLANDVTAGGLLTFNNTIDQSRTEFRVAPTQFVSYQVYETPGTYGRDTTHAPGGVSVTVWRLRRIVEDECLLACGGGACCPGCNPAIGGLPAGSGGVCCFDIAFNILPYLDTVADPTRTNTGWDVQVTRDRNVEIGRVAGPDPRLAQPDLPLFDVAAGAPPAAGPVEGIEPEIPIANKNEWRMGNDDPLFRQQRPWGLRSAVITLRAHTKHEDPDLITLPVGAVMPHDAYDLVPGVPGLARVRSMRTGVYFNNIATNVDPTAGGM